jgi:hypothetical protein
MVSGEPIPVEKTVGAKVIGGAINGTGSFVMKAERHNLKLNTGTSFQTPWLDWKVEKAGVGGPIPSLATT